METVKERLNLNQIKKIFSKRNQPRIPVDRGGLAVAKASSSSIEGLGTTPPRDSSDKLVTGVTLKSSALLGFEIIDYLELENNAIYYRTTTIIKIIREIGIEKLDLVWAKYFWM